MEVMIVGKVTTMRTTMITIMITITRTKIKNQVRTSHYNRTEEN